MSAMICHVGTSEPSSPEFCYTQGKEKLEKGVATSSLATGTPSRLSRGRSSTGDMAVVGGLDVGDGDGGREANTRGEQFANVMRRPIFHAATHYDAIAEEYALPANCNTLTGENLNRYVETLKSRARGRPYTPYLSRKFSPRQICLNLPPKNFFTGTRC